MSIGYRYYRREEHVSKYGMGTMPALIWRVLIVDTHRVEVLSLTKGLGWVPSAWDNEVLLMESNRDIKQITAKEVGEC